MHWPLFYCIYAQEEQRACGSFPDMEIRNYRNTPKSPQAIQSLLPIILSAKFPLPSSAPSYLDMTLMNMFTCSSKFGSRGFKRHFWPVLLTGDWDTGASAHGNETLKTLLTLMAGMQINLGGQRLNPGLDSLQCKYTEKLLSLFPSPCLKTWTLWFTQCIFFPIKGKPESSFHDYTFECPC